MKSTELIIKNKLSSNLILSLGGVFFTIVGILLLAHPYEMDKGGLPYWMLGIFFLPFGLVAIFMLLDSLYLIIRKDEIEIKSLFRKIVIQKEDIVGYGVEEYEMKSLPGGERIRLFCKKGSYKFHTTQYKSIEEIKVFVKDKKIKKNAFRREKIGNFLAILFCFLLIIAPALYDKYISSENEELQAIGIPANFKNDFTIVDEKEEIIKFKLREYHNYLFEVAKNTTPINMKTTNKELVIFIENKEYAQELSKNGFQKLISGSPKIIPVDEIIILE